MSLILSTQSPRRFLEFKEHQVMQKSDLFTTIETNRHYPDMGKAPEVEDRAKAMAELVGMGLNTGVTIEPVMAFDQEPMVELVKKCNPSLVYIGKNTSRNVKLTEPAPEEVVDLAMALKGEGIKVVLKKNIVNYVLPALNQKGISTVYQNG